MILHPPSCTLYYNAACVVLPSHGDVLQQDASHGAQSMLPLFLFAFSLKFGSCLFLIYFFFLKIYLQAPRSPLLTHLPLRLPCTPPHLDAKYALAQFMPQAHIVVDLRGCRCASRKMRTKMRTKMRRALAQPPIEPSHRDTTAQTHGLGCMPSRVLLTGTGHRKVAHVASLLSECCLDTSHFFSFIHSFVLGAWRLARPNRRVQLSPIVAEFVHGRAPPSASPSINVSWRPRSLLPRWFARPPTQ